MTITLISGTVYERGNGLPDVGDYVSDGDDVYEITGFPTGIISTNGAGCGNSIEATLVLADWSDITDDNEPVCSVVVDDEE